MKNITVSVDAELYHRARVRAAEKHSTISALVRNFLQRLVEEEPGFERLRREQNDLIASIRKTSPGFSASKRIARDDVHRRHAVR
jgi:plasmid stability protein